VEEGTAGGTAIEAGKLLHQRDKVRHKLRIPKGAVQSLSRRPSLRNHGRKKERRVREMTEKMCRRGGGLSEHKQLGGVKRLHEKGD